MESQNFDKVNLLKDKIESFADFPVKGINFRDIFSVLRDPPSFKVLIECCKEKIKEIPHVDVIVGIESRGFLFGPLLAYDLQKPFVPIRKKGKLPGDLARVSYKLEYGEDICEIQKASIKPGSKVVIIDDLLATGGSMNAAAELVTSVGAEVSLCVVCIELLDLKGRDKINYKLESVVKF